MKLQEVYFGDDFQYFIREDYWKKTGSHKMPVVLLET